jgi:very-short-patch-repair endonuclease
MDGVMTTGELRAAGFSERAIVAAVGGGDLIRVRRGFYVWRETAPEIRTAAQIGSLTCSSALRLAGAWTMPERRLHVRVGSDSDAVLPGAVVHRFGLAPRSAVDPPLVALEQLCRCSDDLGIVVVLDSALNRRVASRSDIETLLGSSIRRRRLLARIDGTSESGIETIARLRLRSRGIKVRTQVPISGIGRVDLLIGDRLVIELDGREWHDSASTFESDRRRDAALAVRGYIVLRYSYRRVMYEWDLVEREVLDLVRRDRHVARGGRGWRPNM